MKWKPAKEAPEKPGEYSCKTNKGRLVVAEKKADAKFLVIKNPHYLKSNERISHWLDEEIQTETENTDSAK